MVMEDGRVIDSTAARQTHPALTSIHLDTNKRADLFPDSQLRGDAIIARRLDDIRIPMTILSRFDFIIDIPRDAERQMEVALAMYDRPGDVQGPRSPTSRRADFCRKLRVLVAHLRTEHAEIHFPDGIRAYMRSKQEEIWRASADALQSLPCPSSPPRLPFRRPGAGSAGFAGSRSWPPLTALESGDRKVFCRFLTDLCKVFRRPPFSLFMGDETGPTSCGALGVCRCCPVCPRVSPNLVLNNDCQ
jgi:hypothetical protein